MLPDAEVKTALVREEDSLGRRLASCRRWVKLDLLEM
jgi:hypothetical protein